MSSRGRRTSNRRYVRHVRPPTVYLPSTVVRLDQTPSLTREQIGALVPWMRENKLIEDRPHPWQIFGYGVMYWDVYQSMQLPFNWSTYVFGYYLPPYACRIGQLQLSLLWDPVGKVAPQGWPQVAPVFVGGPLWVDFRIGDWVMPDVVFFDVEAGHTWDLSVYIHPTDPNVWTLEFGLWDRDGGFQLWNHVDYEPQVAGRIVVRFWRDAAKTTEYVWTGSTTFALCEAP